MAGPRRYDVSALTDAVAAQWRTLATAAATVTPAEAAAPSSLGDWTVADLLAHVAASVAAVERSVTGPLPAAPTGGLFYHLAATGAAPAGIAELLRANADRSLLSPPRCGSPSRRWPTCWPPGRPVRRWRCASRRTPLCSVSPVPGTPAAPRPTSWSSPHRRTGCCWRPVGSHGRKRWRPARCGPAGSGPTWPDFCRLCPDSGRLTSAAAVEVVRLRSPREVRRWLRGALRAAPADAALAERGRLPRSD